jgi:undecaprenyl-diphosphatase
VALAAAAILAWRRRFGAALFAVAAAGGGILFGTLLKLLFARVRPDIVKHLVETQTTSFPSGHSVNSAAACVALCVLLAGVRDRRLRIGGTAAAIAFALLAGFSRLYFGVHWPSDVLAGWCAGTAWALMCAAVLLRPR